MILLADLLQDFDARAIRLRMFDMNDTFTLFAKFEYNKLLNKKIKLWYLMPKKLTIKHEKSMHRPEQKLLHTPC